MQRLRPLVARVLKRAATDAYLSSDRCLPALGELNIKKVGFLNRSISKPVNPSLAGEFPDLPVQPAANLRIRSRKEQKLKLGSPQPRLAKPAAKRGPSRAAKGKKPLGGKTQQKRPRHAALTPTNAWRSARQACLRDRRDSRPRTRFRATQTSVADADARTASLQNAPPRCETALRQRLPEAPRRELHPAHAAGVHRPR